MWHSTSSKNIMAPKRHPYRFLYFHHFHHYRHSHCCTTTAAVAPPPLGNR
ncbi:hypothetical protein LguiA_012628 [Lonicera macranthoides]